MFGALLLLALMGGCAIAHYAAMDKSGLDQTYFFSDVESISDGQADLTDKTFIIVSAIENVGDEDLEFRTVSRWVTNALGLLGYTRAESKEEASLLVRVAYGRGEPQSTTHTYNTAPGYSFPVGWYHYYVPGKTETVTSRFYAVHLVAEAYLLTTEGKLPQVWKTTLSVTNLDASSSMMGGISNMIADSYVYFGTNTGLRRTAIGDGPEGLALLEQIKK